MISPSIIARHLSLSAVLLTFATSPAVHAEAPVPLPTVLEFNEPTATPFGTHMPDRYDGFRWLTSNWYAMSVASAPANGFLALSGTSTAILSDSGQNFIFDGAEFWSRRGADATGSFYYICYLDGAVIYDGRNDENGRLKRPLPASPTASISNSMARPDSPIASTSRPISPAGIEASSAWPPPTPKASLESPTTVRSSPAASTVRSRPDQGPVSQSAFAPRRAAG